MRYHINDEDEVGVCSAKPGNCRFKNATGDERKHYTSKNDAMNALSAKLNKQYPLSTHRKRALPQKFIKNRTNIKNLLIELNIKDENELRNVNTIQEMITDWFDGDRSRYNMFRDIVNTPLNKESKTAISQLLKNNIKVNVANKSNIDTKPNTIYSNIDILSDSDSEDSFDKITLEKIRENKISPVKFN